MEKLMYLEKGAKKTIDYAKGGEEKCLVAMCVDGFITDYEALCLRDMLWYAKNNGVEVVFVPDDNK